MLRTSDPRCPEWDDWEAVDLEELAVELESWRAEELGELESWRVRELGELESLESIWRALRASGELGDLESWRATGELES